MILEWIGDVILLLVVLPVVIYLLRGVLDAANSIVPSVQLDRRQPPRPARPTSTPPPLLLTTQDQVIKTIAGGRQLRRLARRDPRRRMKGAERCQQPEW